MGFRWPWQHVSDLRKKVIEERGKTKADKGIMFEAIVSMDRERHALDMMVKRSLELLEMKK